jgi:hypothetical protein
MAEYLKKLAMAERLAREAKTADELRAALDLYDEALKMARPFRFDPSEN